jgi:hypothetical protein
VTTRVIAFVAVLLVGAVAPARAWCEASCLAPAAHGDATKPHCPTHEPADAGTSLSATVIDDCPIVESARPTITARVDAQVIATAAIAPHTRTPVTTAPSFVRPHGVTSVFERRTPLRI